MVLTVSFVLFLATGLFCHHRQRDAQATLLQCDAKHRHQQCADIVTNLTPASGRQNHTTSPSASRITRQLMPPRPSHPAPNVRDDREAPLLRTAGWPQTNY
jgi:hypothetical protein